MYLNKQSIYVFIKYLFIWHIPNCYALFCHALYVFNTNNIITGNKKVLKSKNRGYFFELKFLCVCMPQFQGKGCFAEWDKGHCNIIKMWVTLSVLHAICCILLLLLLMHKCTCRLTELICYWDCNIIKSLKCILVVAFIILLSV